MTSSTVCRIWFIVCSVKLLWEEPQGSCKPAQCLQSSPKGRKCSATMVPPTPSLLPHQSEKSPSSAAPREFTMWTKVMISVKVTSSLTKRECTRISCVLVFEVYDISSSFRGLQSVWEVQEAEMKHLCMHAYRETTVLITRNASWFMLSLVCL